MFDSASPDETPARLSEEVAGARCILSRGERRASGRGSNEGAGQARGRYLCFLNPDALVQPGLAGAPGRDARGGSHRSAPSFRCCSTRTARSRKRARSDRLGRLDPGARLRRRRGRLRVPFRREVDYGSAACLLIGAARRSPDGGGFDPAYGLGYFEDVDLCLQAQGARPGDDLRAAVPRRPRAARLERIVAGPTADGGKPGNLLRALERASRAAPEPDRATDVSLAARRRPRLRGRRPDPRHRRPCPPPRPRLG